MSITALPTPPSRSDPANFATRADAFLAALPTFATEANALADAVNVDAAAVAADAATAEAQANAAIAAKNDAEAAAVAASAVSGATQWASGSYATGAVVWSPTNGQNYRRKAPGGASPTDPAADPTNWYSLVSLQGLALTRITGNTTAVAGRHYLIINALELLLPASPTLNDRVGFTDLSLSKAATINPNGGKIRNVAETMTLNSNYAEAVLIASGATEGWV